MISKILHLMLSALLLSATSAFAPPATSLSKTSTNLFAAVETETQSRRSFLGGFIASTAALTLNSLPSIAHDSNSLDAYLYRVLRVREATQQERRLIKSGKFKDIQRANVKLAVRFMVQNYRLGDAVVGASAYLKGGNQMKAIDVGQSAVQSLQTILEYFDTSDVENIKVRTFLGTIRKTFYQYFISYLRILCCIGRKLNERKRRVGLKWTSIGSRKH